jgi:hypothetical protein
VSGVQCYKHSQRRLDELGKAGPGEAEARARAEAQPMVAQPAGMVKPAPARTTPLRAASAAPLTRVWMLR